MNQLRPVPVSLLAIVGVLALLIVLGHNGKINWSLFSIVMTYLGVDRFFPRGGGGNGK
tara:strand:- start:6347 stop:6520 length:174 start_codon:yes stop_codon:yes gene_type:complete